MLLRKYFSIQAALKHRSVNFEFEREPEVKDIEK